MSSIEFREATTEDIPLIFEFTRELAEYEKLLEYFTGTPELIEKTIFTDKKANAIILLYNGEAVGSCLYFYGFSSFYFKPCLYIEDIYVRPSARGKGVGTAVFKYMARKAVNEGCARVDWICLDWNKPSLDFYKGLGATTRDGWIIHKLEGEALKALALED